MGFGVPPAFLPPVLALLCEGVESTVCTPRSSTPLPPAKQHTPAPQWKHHLYPGATGVV